MQNFGGGDKGVNSIGRILNLLRKETPSPGTDYTGTVTKVEGGMAYVQLAGADINDTESLACG